MTGSHSSPIEYTESGLKRGLNNPKFNDTRVIDIPQTHVLRACSTLCSAVATAPVTAPRKVGSDTTLHCGGRSELLYNLFITYL